MKKTYILFLIFCLMTTFISYSLSISELDIITEAKISRDFNEIFSPSNLKYRIEKNVKTITVYRYENGEKGKDYNYKYTFNKDGKIFIYSIITEPGVRVEDVFNYDENGFLDNYIKRQYLNDELYDEKIIKIFRSAQSPTQIAITAKSVRDINPIREEGIIVRENEVLYNEEVPNKRVTSLYTFNENGLLTDIKEETDFYNFKGTKPSYVYKNYKCNVNQMLVEYYERKEPSMSETYYIVEYSEGKPSVLKISDSKENPVFDKKYYFTDFDDNGNWTKYRYEYHRVDGSVYVSYVEREIEYW